MPIKWKKHFDPTPVISRMEETKSIRDDGKVRFEGFIHKEHESILYGMLQFPDRLPEAERRRILYRGIFAAAEVGQLSKDSLLKELNILDKSYWRKPQERFSLLTSLSFRWNVNLKRIHLGRDQIILDRIIKPRFRRESHLLIERAKSSLFADLPWNYSPVRIHVTARSSSEAADIALNHLDLVRGIWNWFFNMRQFIRLSFGGKPKPINRIKTGPIHTLHYVNGKLAAEGTYWYDSTYLGPLKLLNLSPHAGDLNRFASKVLETLQGHKYSSDIKDSIRRYGRSLDERNWNNAFLRLWSVLELLTDTGFQPYKVTIRRASYVFQERDYYTQVLKQLREYRNSTVHDDAESPEIEAYLYQLKNIVEALLSFHIFNSFGFSSINEAAQFLDLPSSRRDLKLRRDMAGFALKYRGIEK
jgi:hypothetical protein